MKRYEKQLKTLYILLFVFAVTFCYTLIILNYHISFVKDNFIFVAIDRSLAITAATGIALSYIIGNLKKLGSKKTEKILPLVKYFGVYGFFSAVGHIFFSLMLISKTNYPYLYLDNGNFNPVGQLTIFLGICAISILIFPAIASIPSVAESMKKESWRRYQQAGYIGTMFIICHIFIVKLIYSLMPQQFYMSLIITLIVFLLLMISLLLKIMTYFYKMKNFN